MAKRLHNMIFSVLCTHQHTQSCLHIENNPRAHTLLSLSLACSLSHTEHVQTNSADTDIHINCLWGEPPAADCRLDLRHRQNQRERSVEPVMCVGCTLHPNPLFLLIVIPCCSQMCKLQIQQSVSSIRTFENMWTNILPLCCCPIHGILKCPL